MFSAADFFRNLQSMDCATLMGNLQFLGTVYDFRVLVGGFIFFVLWEFCWKGFALWRAARMRMPGWFIALLLIQSLGIVPILFLRGTKSRYRSLNSGSGALPGRSA